MKKIIGKIVAIFFMFIFAPFFFVGYVGGLILSPVVIGLKDGLKHGSEQTRNAMRKLLRYSK